VKLPVDRIDVAIATVERREGKGPLPCSVRSQLAHLIARQAEERRKGRQLP
jgi:hypothetical protein